MSKMETNVRKGTKKSRLAVFTMLLALLVVLVSASAGLFSALAADATTDTEGTYRYSFDIYAGGKIKQDGEVVKSTADTINFRSDNVFGAYTPTASTSWWGGTSWDYHNTRVNGVKAFKITLYGVTGAADCPVILTMTDGYNKDCWTQGTTKQGDTTLTYVSKGSKIDENAFNGLMSYITLKFNPLSNSKSVSNVSASIIAYSDTKMTRKSQIWFNTYQYDKNGQIKTDSYGYPVEEYSKYYDNLIAHTCKFTFYGFAEGAVDTDSKTVDYRNEFVSNWDRTYDETVTDGVALSNLRVTPQNGDRLKATFDVSIVDVGSSGTTADGERFGYRAALGYQIKPHDDQWTNAWTPVMLDEAEIDLTDPVTAKEPHKVTITEGLYAGEAYDIRGVVVTDGKSGSPKYTDSYVTVQYNMPEINNFSAGGTGKVYKGGDLVQVTSLVTGNDTNAVGVDYQSQETNSSPHTGPALRAQLYFTEDYTVANGSINGKSAQLDKSKWYKIGAAKYTDAEFAAATSNTFTPGWNITLPKNVGEMKNGVGAYTLGTSAELDRSINSTNCALKLVVTDLYTGYASYIQSDTFAIDAEPPTGLTVNAKDADGKTMNLSLTNAENSVVGGTGAQVKIRIGGAKDSYNASTGKEEGTGVKEYQYNIYYLSTVDGAKLGSTRAAVLQRMSTYNGQPTGSQTYTYTPWAVGEDAYDTSSDGTQTPVENYTQVNIAKDGYYRIDAKAIDNAGYESTPVSAYFQVDLSAPTTPVAYLAKQTDNNAAITEVLANPQAKTEAYNNLTYTDSKVWLFAYSKPITGKVVKEFRYSTDGGLTWYKFNERYDASRKAVITNTSDGTVSGTPYYLYDLAGTKKISAFTDEKCTVKQDVVYQAALDLSAMGLSDYQSILVQAVDQLGNESLTSQEAVMRTTPQQIAAEGSLTHQPIEVALAMGNTTMQTSTLTPLLKNRAACIINEKYFGTSGTATKGDANFNPYLYVKDHSCSWDDVSCAGKCNNPSCPYEEMEAAGYSVYKPQLINVQGMTNVNASDLNWVRYDHSMYNSLSTPSGTIHIPTVAYTSTGTPSTTNLQGDPQYGYHTYGGKQLALAARARVVYTGQSNLETQEWTNPADKVTYTIPKQDNVANGTSTIVGTNNQNTTHYWVDASHANQSSKQNAVETYNSSGKWFVAYQEGWSFADVAKRIYHMADLSTATTLDGGGDITKKGDMSTMGGFSGYFRGAVRDWMFMYNDQPGKKIINFTIDDTTVFAHSSDGYGFFFNTTIRQNKAGRWVISGYLLYDGNSKQNGNSTPCYPTTFRTWILKFTDVDMECFADGGGNAQDLALQLVANNQMSVTGGGTITTLAYSDHDTTSVCARNYRLVCEGDWSTFYLFNSGSTTYTAEQLDEKFKASSLAAVTLNNSSNPATSEYKTIKWKKSYSDSSAYTATVGDQVSDGTRLYTPRPTVDSEQIGPGKDKVHTDSNCYGFGPLTASRSTGHGCFADSRVVFSNVNMTMNVVRKLSEVVTEPQWGSGKSKFITNISNTAVEDFKDPMLTSNIQWRMKNDNTRYVGWGEEENREETISFLKRMAGEDEADKYSTYGMYESADVDPLDTQINNVATYITQEYYADFGYDANSSTPVNQQVNAAAGGPEGHGKVYALNNIKSINLSVTPEEYNTSSANPDFPSGRWYMVHDINGTNLTKPDVRNGKPSDALETDITLAGRYTYYFAPSAADTENGTLNPANAVFDFIVNQTPLAQFKAKLVDSTVDEGGVELEIEDKARDPDGTHYAHEYSYTYIDSSGVKRTVPYAVAGTAEDIQISGIVETQWRYQLLMQTGTGDDAKAEVIAERSWSDASLDGKTLWELSGNRYHKLQDGMVLNVYQRVVDVAAARVAVTDAKGNVTGYKYVATEEQKSTSLDCMVNVTNGAVEITYQAQSVLDPDKLSLYDTAKDSDDTDKRRVYITRDSSHTDNTPFFPTWYVDLGAEYKLSTSSDNYVPLKEDASGNYYATLKGTNVTILHQYEAPVNTAKLDDPAQTQGTTGGVWYMDDTFLSDSRYVGPGKSVGLRLVESTYGVSAEEAAGGGNDKSYITDKSARTIEYLKDEKAPAAQVVTSLTYTDDGTGNYASSPYEASKYLDVTNNDKYIEISATGSEDGEGVLRGYAYYFYDKNASGAETAYYQHNKTTHELTPVGTAAAALNYLNADGKETIRIDKNTMCLQLNATPKKPTGVFNVAIFAYDNQTGMGTLTGGNQTKVTRIQDIKLSTSKPMPPALTVKDSMSAVIASVGNDNGYEGMTDSNDVQVKVNDKGQPTYYTNTAVTVDFTPRKGKFKQDANGDLVKCAQDASGNYTEAGTDYYEDIYQHADMTGVADINYTLMRADKEGGALSQYDKQEGWPSATSITVKDDGYYELTASVVSGAGTESTTRKVCFVIDATAPTGDTSAAHTKKDIVLSFKTEVDGSMVDYQSTWTKSVVMDVSAAYDLNDSTAKLQYSVDNGKTWWAFDEDATDPDAVSGVIQPNESKRSSITSGQTLTFTRSGEWNVMVRAVDFAGNITNGTYTRGGASFQTVNVKIDGSAPVLTPLSVKAGAENVSVYAEYETTVSWIEGNANITAIVDGEPSVLNYTNTRVSVPRGKDLEVEFSPTGSDQEPVVTQDNRKLVKGVDYTLVSSGPDTYRLSIEDVYEEHSLDIKFLDSVNLALADFSYMSVSRNAYKAASYSAAMRNMAPLNVEGRGAGTIAVTVNVPGGGYVTVNGTRSDDPVEVNPGAVSLHVYPNNGNRVKSIQIDGADAMGQFTKETDSENMNASVTMTKDTNIYVVFEKIPTRVITVSYNDAGTAELVYNRDTMKTLEDDENGNKRYEVRAGAVLGFKLKPYSADYVALVTVNGSVEAENVAGESYSYTVGAKPAGEDPGLVIDFNFDVTEESGYVECTTIAKPFDDEDEDKLPHGTITPSSTASRAVRIPAAGSRVFTFTPESTKYQVASVWLTTENEDGATEVRQLSPVSTGRSDGSMYCTVSSSGVDMTLTVRFQKITYGMTIATSGGVACNVAVASATPGESINTNWIDKGTSLIITPKPAAGYKISNLAIIYLTSGMRSDLGAVSSYRLESINDNIKVEATFRARKMDGLKSAHSITAVASGVKDNEDALAESPYRFCISTADHKLISSWSEWSSSNTITYTGIVQPGTGKEVPLDPNAQYYVYMQARDKVGNVTGEVAEITQDIEAHKGETAGAGWGSAYTKPNVPGTAGAEAVNREGDDYNKSVALNVETNGNPEDTEYLVYYSESASMTPSHTANESVNGGWATLKNGQFIIDGLSPGVLYYLQVVARNHDKVASDLDTNDTSSIMVSPAAPPANSFYFEDQASPTSPLKLTWTEPADGVTKVIIYRDDQPLAEVSTESRYYYEDPVATLTGDHFAKYSYAYVNEAGIGSSRMAVSKERFEAENKAETDSAAQAILTAMINAEKSYADMFSEVLTYPKFPSGILQPRATSKDEDSESGNANSGTLTVTMQKSSLTDRYQKYELQLKGYNKDPLTGAYTEVPAATWDPTGVNSVPKTTTTTASGAQATWENLATAYEYRVFVRSVSSVGARTNKNWSDLCGQYLTGLEGLLGKSMKVTPEGWSVTYGNTAEAAKYGLSGSTHKWGDAIVDATGASTPSSGAAFVDGYEDGWDTAMTWTGDTTGGYIKFNKTPHVDLPTTQDQLYSGDLNADKLRTAADGSKYLVIDDQTEDKHFTLKVAAWDYDGPRESSTPTLSATISNVHTDGVESEEFTLPWTMASEAEAKAESTTPENLAKREDRLYTLTFDGSALPTGVYEVATLKAFDGDTVDKQDKPIKLIVNRTTPTIQLGKSANQLVEAGLTFDEGCLEASAKLADQWDTDVQAQQNLVALSVMPKQFASAFGIAESSVTMDYFRTQLVNTANSALLSKAKALLGDADWNNSRYVEAGKTKLTEAGLQRALGRVEPEVELYLSITEAQYNENNTEANKGKLRREENVRTGVVTWWAEKDFAIQNGLCTWIGADGVIKSQDDEGNSLIDSKFMGLLVSSFSQNVSSTSVNFTIKRKPSVTIISDEKLTWVETEITEEFKNYEKLTVREVIDSTSEICAKMGITPEYGDAQLTDQAARFMTDEEGNILTNSKGENRMEVFKLMDSQAQISTNFISANVVLDFGTKSVFNEIGVLFSTDETFDPNVPGTVIPDDMIRGPIHKVNYDVFRSSDATKVYSFSNEKNLEPNQTYYLWSYYKITETGEVGYTQNYVALTTSESYKMGYFGFQERGVSYKENEASGGDVNKQLIITQTGESTVQGVLTITPTYYQADEFGNIKTDGDGNLLQLTPEKQAIAERVFSINGGNEITTDSSSRYYVPVKLHHDGGDQGHMVVRLNLSVKENINPYCYTRPGQEYIDVFVLDQESQVSTFELGVWNKKDDGVTQLMEEIKDASGTKVEYYSYDFPGLKLNYKDLGKNTIDVRYFNQGTGDLEDIQAGVWATQDGLTASTDFVVSTPSNTTLLAGEGSEVQSPYVTIEPARGLSDGVHEAWVILKANHMESANYVKIHVRQVVGQSTLKGRVYITPDAPQLEEEVTGKATVNLYDWNTGWSKAPLYTATTDEEGFYEIPNILNGRKYFIEVKRNGYVTFDGYSDALEPQLNIPPAESGVYELNFRLLGGDLTNSRGTGQDGTINSYDLNVLLKYYNTVYDKTKPAVTEDEKMQRLCDFNNDGAVNALDRSFLIGNMYTANKTYKDAGLFGKLTPTEIVTEESPASE